MTDALRVVSPLALSPRCRASTARSSAAIGDRLVPPDQVRDLWRHWERPRIEWYQGSHLTLGMHRGVRALTEETLRGAGLAS